MAARIRPLSPAKLDEMRKRIKSTLLLEKLQDHVFGAVELSATQLRAAEVLLKKTMPDLASTDSNVHVTGSLGEALEALPVVSSPEVKAETLQ